MKRHRPPQLSDMSNHDLGKELVMVVDAIDAGGSDSWIKTRRTRDAMLEAAARLHPDWPGKTIGDTKEQD